MYKFIHHNISYQLFNVSQSSSSTSTFSRDKILLLTKPQIVCYSDVNFNKYNGRLPHVLPNNNSNFAPMTSQDSINNLEIKQQLLTQKTRARPRRRNQINYHTKDKYKQNERNINYKINQSATEPINLITKHKKNQIIVTKTNIEQISSDQTLEHKIQKNNIIIQNPLSIHELSTLIFIPESEIIKWLFLKGISVTINQILDVNIATSVAQNYGFIVQNNINFPTTSISRFQVDVANMTTRAPIITVLGYTSHGKTTLLQALQKSEYKNKATGGTTQLIEVHEIDIRANNKNKKVIFLDTPGHEAFTSIRSRSIQIADMAILVVAADDTLKLPTIETIKHLKDANIPIIIAINKIDKTQASTDKISAQLTADDLVSQDCGNSISIIPVSSTHFTNIDQLISKIMSVTDQQNLRANLDEKASGTIIDALLDKSRGSLASVLVQNGTLSIGDFLVARNSFTKVRAMLNCQGTKIQKAIPSTIVEIWGFSQIPKAGSPFTTTSNEKEAKKKALEHKNTTTSIISLQKRLHSRITTNINAANITKQTTNIKQLNLILKTDTQASIEAILFSFSRLSQEKVQLNVISIASGMITETDIQLAAVSNSVIIGFNTVLAPGARPYGEKKNIVIYEYKLIYHLLNNIKNMMNNLAEPEYVEQFMGTARVNSVFSLSKGIIAGCIVTSGKITCNSKIRVIRKGAVIHEGMLKSLRHMKEDIQEATEGNEFGILAASFQEWNENDCIEFYCKQKRANSL